MFSSDSEESEEGDSSDEIEGKESIKRDPEGSEKLSTADLESSSEEEEGEGAPVFTSPLIPGESHGKGNIQKWKWHEHPSLDNIQ